MKSFRTKLTIEDMRKIGLCFSELCGPNYIGEKGDEGGEEHNKETEVNKPNLKKTIENTIKSDKEVIKWLN